MALSLLLDLLRVSRMAGVAEAARLSKGPRAAVEMMRAVGQRNPRRDARRRVALRRAIRLVDRWHPGGPNCYRRVLLELALDRGAAEDRVMMGLRVSGSPGSGHAWLGSERHDSVYDVLLVT